LLAARNPRFECHAEKRRPHAAQENVRRRDHQVNAVVVSPRFEQPVIYLRTGGVADRLVSGRTRPKRARLRHGDEQDHGADQET
jgi:hypothetical protein